MAEQRLIDANKISPVDIQYYGKVVDWTTIEHAHKIDPETLPIIHQLREELANCKQELRQIKYCYDIAKNGEKQLRKQNDEIIASWSECTKKLKQVTAERDAAIKDMETAMRFDYADDIWSFLCSVCENKFPDGKCSCVGDDCVPKWRGTQKKENI